MKKYNLRKSTFTQAADWYGQRTWFQKTALSFAATIVTIVSSTLISAVITPGQDHQNLLNSSRL